MNPDPHLFVAKSDAGLALLAADITSAARTEPIICLTSRPQEDEPALDPSEVREIVGPDAPIYFVRTGDATRILQELLPAKLHVFGGAARIWWPGVNERSALSDHPLIVDRYGVYGSQALGVMRRAWNRPSTAPRESDHPVIDQLTSERDALAARNQELAAETAQLTTELAATRDRATATERRAREISQLVGNQMPVPEAAREPLDPVGEFLLLVYIEWLRNDPGTRDIRPLVEHRVGSRFLESIDATERVSTERVAWVCARIATRTPAESEGLEAHPLRTGAGGNNPQRERGDGAKAWRCALKRNTPNAPRLHYWILEDGSMEFAAARRHDDFDIPEH